ncbi:MAG: TonB family protein [Spirochaetaceae bacterium]|jgi:protein TonB|nr:TonB family protein [Spirochaetaceae bacterium]
MPRPFPLFPVLFGFSLVLHAALFLISPGLRRPPVPAKEEQLSYLSLINIEVLEPKAAPQAAPPPPEPPPPPPPAAVDPAAGPVDEYTVIDEIPPRQEEPAGDTVAAEEPEAAEAESPVASLGPAAGLAAGRAAETAPPETPALIAAYVRRNLDQIRRRIRDKLVYPARARRIGAQGKVEAVFTIHPDGSVGDVLIRESSGQEILDKAIIDAIYAAAPFPPPPARARIAAPITFRLR